MQAQDRQTRNASAVAQYQLASAEQNNKSTLRILAWPGLLMALSAWAIAGAADAQYLQTNLVSDIPGLAAATDANLQNPWGIASSATSPLWITDNRTGVATLYNGDGVANALVVTVSPPLGAPSRAHNGASLQWHLEF